MVTRTATRAGVLKTAAATGWAQDVKRAWGTFEYGADAVQAVADTIVMCKLPKGAIVVGGLLTGDKIDSNLAGSALLSINIGIDQAVVLPNGTTVTSASTSVALANAWSLGPDAAVIVGVNGENGRRMQLGGLLVTDGPLLCTADCNAYIVTNATALNLTTGTLTLLVDYYMASHV